MSVSCEHWASPSDLLPVIERAYGTVDGSAAWSDCLDALIRLGAFDACALIQADLLGSRTELLVACGFGAPLGRQMLVAASAPCLNEIVLRSAPGAVWLEPDLAERLELRDSPAWRDWLAPQGFQAWGCGVIDRAATEVLYLEFLGRHGRAPFGGDTLRLLYHLLPHLRRAWQLHRILAAAPAPARPRQIPPAAADPMATLGTAFELRLRRRFLLTRAEARLGAQLCSGLSLKAIADRLHVSIHTVRSQLQAIFQKTETCRQAELISLFLRETEAAAAADETPPRQARQRWR